MPRARPLFHSNTALPLRRRSANRFVYRPSSTQKAVAKKLFRQPGMSDKLGKSERLPLILKTTICRAVIRLLSACRPPAISWFVASIVVNPFKRVFAARPFAHVFKEVGKCPPTLANSDSALSIVLVPKSAWVKAARNHRAPRTVGQGAFALPCVAVGRATAPASARDYADAERVRCRDVFPAAIAKAEPPYRSLPLSADTPLNGSVAKSAPGKIGHARFIAVDAAAAGCGAAGFEGVAQDAARCSAVANAAPSWTRVFARRVSFDDMKSAVSAARSVFQRWHLSTSPLSGEVSIA